MTTERLAMRLLAVNVLAEMMWAKTQDPQRHHGWQIASSAPPGNYRLLAKHPHYQTAAKTTS